MKSIIILLLLVLITGCQKSKVVYWCGDHACVNKKERESYFKKTMIVEIKEISKIKIKKKSDSEKITNQALLDDKNLRKQARIEEKSRIKEQKVLIKQARIEEKSRIKEQKVLIKQARENEKFKIKIKKESKKKINLNKKNYKNNTEPKESSFTSFTDLVNEIVNRNKFKSYPDINKIEN